MELEDLVKIFNHIKDFLVKNDYIGHVNFTGGEPFVSEHLWKLVELCDLNNISFGILTNGTLLDYDTLARIGWRRSLKFIQFSLDGSRKVHDYIRGKGSFNKTIKAIKIANRLGIQTMVSFTASKDNYKNLKDAVRICQRYHVDRVWTDRLVPFGSNTLNIMSNEDFKDYLKILRNETLRNNILQKIGLSKTTVHNNRALQFLCDTNNEIYNCSAGKRLLTILEDGTLLPCRRLPIELGNVIDNSIVDIVESSNVIKELNENRVPDNCSRCLHKSNCKGGAKCLSYAVNKELYTKDINCSM